MAALGTAILLLAKFIVVDIPTAIAATGSAVLNVLK